ncbi:hypothetical protein ECHHL_0627 [Ehrlichia chaffeensis str. Heartland]|uniref:hypothetical protein n=1 Tax=Ehrlichia chaffeensis TaxID=945 RepID=UPI000444D217|nr:hypothetical protein [Ehrlichia chaffeensis]AHX03779.1 hypothetical protein ECHHL_0627 [Ehrlichia chaffeensis str. Heartland]AHX08852.1 hypothetical protein ECHSTV_0416 [Ehrlichia chaffeensis str. Saint Vincent]
MNKTQSLSVLLTCFLIFAAAALLYRFRNDIGGYPYLNVAAILIMAVMAIAMLVTIVHIAMMCSQSYTKIEAALPSIEEGKQVIVFVPLTENTVRRLNFGSEISKIECDGRASILNLGPKREKSIVLKVTRKYGLCSQKTVNVGVDGSRKCAVLFNNQQAAQIEGPGLYCITKFNKNSEKLRSELQDDISMSIEYVETTHAGDLLVYYTYNRRQLTESSMSFLLNKEVEDKSHTASDGGDTITLYEVVLRGLLRSCPSSPTLIFPSDDCQDSEAWVNSGDGRLALSFLLHFSPASILGSADRLKDKTLVQKVRFFRDYIIEKDLNPNDDDLPVLGDKIKYKFFETHDKLSSYRNLENRFTTRGISFFRLLRDQVQGDDIVAGMLALAAHQFRDATEPETRSNMCLRNILNVEGKHDMTEEVRQLFGSGPDSLSGNDPYSIITFASYKLMGLGISPALKFLQPSLGPACTLRELVNGARKYVMDIYWSNIVVPDMALDGVNFGPIEDTCLCTGRDIEIDSSSDDVSLTSEIDVCCFGGCSMNPYSRMR